MKTRVTLLELSNILTEKGFADIFDGDIEDCLNFETMTGDWADVEGNEIIDFDIIELSPETDHLNTIVEVDLGGIK